MFLDKLFVTQKFVKQNILACIHVDPTPSGYIGALMDADISQTFPVTQNNPPMFTNPSTGGKAVKRKNLLTRKISNFFQLLKHMSSWSAEGALRNF